MGGVLVLRTWLLRACRWCAFRRFLAVEILNTEALTCAVHSE